MYLKKVVNTDLDIKFKEIKTSSLKIKKDDVFIPFGGVSDRNLYIDDAIKRGARCIITNHDIKQNIPYVKIDNLEKHMISIFDKYYDFPLQNIDLIGITGTDGKTTVASILSNLLNIPMIGTTGFTINKKNYNLDNTTPSLDSLYKCFDKVRKKKYDYIAMEVSSEAYLTNRIATLPFKIGIFTNITKEHLDKHYDFSNYLNCKMQLFRNSEISILNRDSKYFKIIKSHAKKCYSYGFKLGSTLRILNYKLLSDKTIMKFKYQKKKYKVEFNLIGKFNVYNIAAAILSLLVLGYEIDDIICRLKLIKPVPGRMDMVYNDDFRVVIDYAHTINATKNVLKFFKRYSKKKIITVVGCAGGRYKEKRSIIGKLALKYSNLVIFTMDDPRYEDVDRIIDDMISKSRKNNYIRILDREEALHFAFNYADSNNIILLLGKGTDNYMMYQGKKIHYSDYEVVKKYLK